MEITWLELMYLKTAGDRWEQTFPSASLTPHESQSIGAAQSIGFSGTLPDPLNRMPEDQSPAW